MKVAIIGGGACGLVLANILEEHHISYELFEKSLCGRKLLASGNGKANIGNQYLDESKYNHPFGYELVEEYKEKLASFWQRLGLYTKTDMEGRIYPYSESSLSVFKCLTRKLSSVTENFPITSITKMNQKYYLNDVRGPFDYVVFTTGSFASFIPRKQKDFYQCLTGLSLTMTPLHPSLVGFKLKCDFQRLNGVRLKCVASLIQKNQCIAKEKGEVILKSDGISGICILNLSAFYNRLKDKNDCFISLDLLPQEDIIVYNYEELIGIVQPKLVDYLMKFPIEKLNQILHDLQFEIVGVYDYEFAQVVSGGIDLSEINENLQLKKDGHLFAGGEILDIDGVCGGYNLMFAFCCGLKIGEYLCNIK